MITGRSREEVGTAAAVAPIQRFLEIVTATSLVALFPMAAVWWLRASGVLSSYLPGMAIGVALSFGAAYAGRRFWQTRPGSQHLLFSELLVWGYLHRLYSERRLASARAVLGTMSQAQRRIEGGLSPERQTKLLEQLATGMDARDPKTYGHSRRVARYSWMIAMRMGLPREEVARIRTAAAVHDVGKIETPLEILRKQGPLNDEEYGVMKRHPADGARMVSVLNDDGLTEMVLHHHERLDGTGYPDRLSGQEIPLGARIISVADTFDAITAHRPYQAARPHKEALDILMKESGKQLDPDVVTAFCRHYSGRRPLTFWTSLMTLPERALSQLSSGLGAVAAAAKVAAVAALVGALAAGTATLAHPAPRTASQELQLTSELAPTPTAALGGGSGHASGGVPASGSQKRAAARLGAQVSGSSGANGVAAPGSAGGSSAAQPGYQTLADGSSASESPAAAGTGGGKSTGHSEGTQGAGNSEGAKGGGGSGAGGSTETGHGGQGKSESPTLKSTVKGTVEGTLETTKGTVKEVGKTVGEVGKTVGEAGKTVGEVTTPVKETTGKVVEEVKNKVVNEVPSKVTEVKSKVGEVVGKLKL